ncbi:MAG TPA: PhoH family protein [Candidatus Dependentiae bacterium]|nr:PhoH family protein [Candidatus Dependentiae bacterium]HRQ62584.1 PhoH family protein [Candidatus Dependentiae bacterium]
MTKSTRLEKKRIYVLDTNVLIHDPTAMYAFKGSWVAIPSIVLEEIDKFKKEGTDRGRNARETIRLLDELRGRGSLGTGVTLEDGTIIQVFFPPADEAIIMPFSLRIEDNIIVSVAFMLKEQGHDVQFISKDLNARVKADALGIAVQDYMKEYISEQEFYQGWTRVKVPGAELKQGVSERLTSMIEDADLSLNQYVLFEDEHNPERYRVFRYMGDGMFKSLERPEFKWPLNPRNAQQFMALDLLTDHDINLITLLGPAGTGKTFLALLAGLHQVLIDDEYEKMLISRPVVPLGRDIGYVPGTIEEKLHSWMLPIYDNMEFIMHEVNVAHHFEELETEHGRRKGKARKKYRKSTGGLASLDTLMHQGKVSLEAITYMRGRSIPYQFILIDEAQNLTPHEVKTLITRVGEGSKIILAGDPYQIDSPYLDFGSNGLVYTSEKFRGQKLFGSVFLETSERSELSRLAGKLL